MVNGRRERSAGTHLGVVLLQGVIHLEDFRLFAREEARLTDVAVEVSERSVAKAEHGDRLYRCCNALRASRLRWLRDGA